MTLRFNVKIYVSKSKGLGRLQVTHMNITDLYSSTHVSFYCVLNIIIERYKIVTSGRLRIEYFVLTLWRGLTERRTSTDPRCFWLIHRSVAIL